MFARGNLLKTFVQSKFHMQHLAVKYENKKASKHLFSCDIWQADQTRRLCQASEVPHF